MVLAGLLPQTREVTEPVQDARAPSRSPAREPGQSQAQQPGRRVGVPTWARPRLPSPAWAALLVVWVVWGSTYLAIRVADRTIEPFPMAAARYLIAGAVMYPAVWLGARRRRPTPEPPTGRSGPGGLAQWAGMAVVGTMLLAFGNGGVSYAEQTLPSGLAALLVASVPLWMALADWIINGRRIRPLGWVALGMGLAGVAVLAQPPAHGGFFPVLVVLGASMSWGTGSVLADRMPAPASPLLGSAMEMLTGGAVLAVIAAATGELTHASHGPVSAQSLLAVAYLIGPGSLLALTCYVIALRRLPTSAVSTYAYVNPVVAVALGTLILGERLTPATVLGGAIVVASVALLLMPRARSAR
jgi:drug/metabolite transporter (DMT)-like permease